LADDQPWLQATVGACVCVLCLVQVAVAKGYLSRFPRPLQRSAGFALWLSWVTLLFLTQKGG
jgi:hypothetical protein